MSSVLYSCATLNLWRARLLQNYYSCLQCMDMGCSELAYVHLCMHVAILCMYVHMYVCT